MTPATVLLTAARFGGSYFLDLYRQSTPGGLVLQEVFRPGSDNQARLGALLGIPADQVAPWADSDPAGLWRAIRAACADPARPVIAKAYYYHQPRTSPLWDEIAGSSRVIHLIRHNLFDSYVSRLIAEQSGHWQIRHSHNPPDQADIDPVTIDPKAADRYIRMRLEEIAWAREQFRDADYHEIAFEDIRCGPRSWARALSRIVSPDQTAATLPSARLTPDLIRIKRVSNADIITNYPDVAHLDQPNV